MIFIYDNCVPTRWQWSVDLYKNSKDTAVYKMRSNATTQNTLNRKQTYKTRKRI